MKTSLPSTRRGKIIKMFKASIYAGIVFGLLMSAKYGVREGIIVGVLFSVTWGVVVGSILLLVDSYMRRTNSGSSELAEKQITVSCCQESTFYYCVEAVKLLKLVKKMSTDNRRHTIEIRTKFSISSFGEIINIVVVASHEQTNSSFVFIRSRPVLITTILDYGKNVRNVNFVTSAILEKTFDCQSKLNPICQ